MKTISIAKDFSVTPGARYEYEGPFPGKEFREKLLSPAIKEALETQTGLMVDLDGTAGLGTSFLEESFGGLIREDKFPYDKVIELLDFKSDENPDYVVEIKQYMKEAYEKLAN